jgi:hypothetical protein
MKWLLILSLLKPLLTFACLPSEIHIREQLIDTYTKKDGTRISAHLRSEHCREINEHNYFQDSSSIKFKNFKSKFKPWIISEKNLINSELQKLPPWLKEYRIANLLRATVHEGNPKNAALTYPDSKTVIIFDAFFNSSEKQSIILHELSHIAIWDTNPDELLKLFISNGWTYKNGKSPEPPQKVIIPDSSHSPSEDFANSVEMYYSDPKRLKEFNPKSFLILESIIKSKEKK